MFQQPPSLVFETQTLPREGSRPPHRRSWDSSRTRRGSVLAGGWQVQTTTQNGSVFPPFWLVPVPAAAEDGPVGVYHVISEERSNTRCLTS